MSWLIKIAFNFLGWFSFLFLVVYDRTKSKEFPEEIEPAKTFSVLSRPHVRVSNPNEVTRKLQRMVREGPGTLQILTDFDKTLTKPNKTPKPVFSSLEIFQEMEEVPESFKNDMEAMWSKLSAALGDRTLAPTEKILICQQSTSEYMERIRNLQVENIPKLIAREAVRTFKLRDGMDKTFVLLKESSVPITVLSAGLGDVILPVFRHNDIDVKSVRILSNFLKYDNGSNRIQGFLDGLISMFNKSEQALKRIPEEMAQRPNIIVLGDDLADAEMADGALPAANLLKIGFLNHNAEKLMDIYTGAFDIVIVEDFTMNVIIELLQEILQPVI